MKPIEYELDSKTMKHTGRTRARQFTVPKKPLVPGCKGYPEPESFKNPKAKR
jgi:hypothetical protein